MYRQEERAFGWGPQKLLQIHENLAHRGAAGGSLTAEGSTLCAGLFSSLASHIILSEKPSFSFGETVLPTAHCRSVGADPEYDVCKHRAGPCLLFCLCWEGPAGKAEAPPPS